MGSQTHTLALSMSTWSLNPETQCCTRSGPRTLPQSWEGGSSISRTWCWSVTWSPVAGGTTIYSSDTRIWWTIYSSNRSGINSHLSLSLARNQLLQRDHLVLIKYMCLCLSRYLYLYLLISPISVSMDIVFLASVFRYKYRYSTFKKK